MDKQKSVTLPDWAIKYLPLLSFLLAASALGLAWVRYTHAATPNLTWFELSQAVMHASLLALAGGMWLWSLALSFLRKKNAPAWFLNGFYTVISILLFNLLLLIVRAVHTVTQENIIGEIAEKIGSVISNPISLVGIFIVGAIIVVSIINEKNK